MQTLTAHVPASTANVGPGFDALGAALTLHLRVDVTFAATVQYSSLPLATSSSVDVSYEGDSPEHVSTAAHRNYIMRVASIVAALHGRMLPACKVHVSNPIPLGRGLGSSGAAIVAGVLIADLTCGLRLPRAKLLDHAVFFEGHPDNVSPSLLGGFCASYLSADIKPIVDFIDNLPSFVPEVGVDNTKPVVVTQIADVLDDKPTDGLPPPIATAVLAARAARTKYLSLLSDMNLTTSAVITKSFSVRNIPASNLKCVAVIPEFKVPTAEARKVLPATYSREDVVYNIQRTSVLVALLTSPSQGLGLADYLLEPLQVHSSQTHQHKQQQQQQLSSSSTSSSTNGNSARNNNEMGINGKDALNGSSMASSSSTVSSVGTLGTSALLSGPFAASRRTVQADFFKGSIGDRVHQEYRKGLVPGLTQILDLNKHIQTYAVQQGSQVRATATTAQVSADADGKLAEIQGLLGVFMSGAGPTVLAFAYDNHEQIAGIIRDIWASARDGQGNAITSETKILEVDLQGAYLTV